MWTQYWPQIVMLLLTAMSFGIVLSKHGKPRDNYNIFYYLCDSSLALWLLYEGGFWRGML